MSHKEISELVGLTFESVLNLGDEMTFQATNGRRFRFYHEQDCCEAVSIYDVIGDLKDLEGSPLLVAEQVTNADEPDCDDESFTWTFYRFSTVQGTVTVRWLGTSNGYYSESVDFEEC